MRSAAETDSPSPPGVRPSGGRVGIARRHLADPLTRSAYSLALNSLLIAALGMAFWIVAARLYPSSSVGRDSALIAAMVQLSTIAQLNLANLLVRFMPGYTGAGRLLLGAYAASSVTAIALGSAFVFAAPRISTDFAFLGSEPLTAVGYVGAVVLWGIFALQDAALTAMRQAPWVPIENGVYGLLKLAGLPVLFALGITHGPLLAWVIPMAVLLLPVNWLLFRRILVQHRSGASDNRTALPFEGRRLARFLAFDYLSTVFLQTSLTVLPLLVVAILGSAANGHFYVAFTIAIAVESLFTNIAMSLVVEGALAPERLPALLRLLVKRVAVFALPMLIGLVVTAPLVLLPFGEEYVRESTGVLRILLVATVFRAAFVFGAAIWRLEGSTGRSAALDGCLLVGLVILAGSLAPQYGISGVAIAWLTAAAAVGLAVLPTLVTRLRAGGRPG